MAVANSRDSVDAFFSRCRLSPGARLHCDGFVHCRFPTSPAEPAGAQGYCSYTVNVGADTIVQFRPAAHRLNVDLARHASGVYSDLSPLTEFLGTCSCTNTLGAGSGPCPSANGSTYPSSVSLYAYSMSRIPGVSLAEFRATSCSGAPQHGDVLVGDFARFLSRGWYGALQPSDPSLHRFKGPVGRSLHQRLDQMHARLPLRFRPTVAAVLESLDCIEALPWVLTHGDVVPSNIMVDPESFRLRGLVDWAEAEYLPFGAGLYGVEELLGAPIEDICDTEAGGSGGRYPAPGTRFWYYPEARWLRRRFWEELVSAIPDLGTDRTLRRTVESARLLGLLLWHGIAFDDGKLDRVVEEGRDDEEIQKLDLFLLGHGAASAHVNQRTPFSPCQPLALLWMSITSLGCKICGG